jgi:hypothetical protein
MAGAMKQHYMECEECWENYMLVLDMFDLLEEERLSDIMEVEPVTEKDLGEIQPITAIISGVKEIFDWGGESIVIPIAKEGKVTIELAGKILLDKIFELRDFRGVVATSTKYGEEGDTKIPRELLAETEGYKIELEKGTKEGKIIVTKVE